MSLSKPKSIEILLLLLLTDLVIIGIHIVVRLFSTKSGMYWLIDQERGLGETFQHIKELWLVFSFVALIRLRSSWSYLSLSLFFGYILLDDLFLVHEKVGETIAAGLNLQPMFGLRAVDFGELIVSAIAGTFFAVVIGWSYWRGNKTFREVCKRVGALFGGLVFCGIALDMLHIVVERFRLLSASLEILEDGGELLFISGLCWYGVSLLTRQNQTSAEFVDTPKPQKVSL